MTIPNFAMFGPEERRAALNLAGLIVLLWVGAFVPQLTALSGFPANASDSTWNVPLIILFINTLIVVSLGGYVIYLRALNRSLDAARGADSHAALHDPLTGAANRRHFEIRLDQLINDPAPMHTLLMIDLDRFKPVNDLYGHAAGDQLLKELSVGLQRLVRPTDMVARLGGDEFAILVVSDQETAAIKTSISVLEYVTKYRLNWDDQRISVGTSIGLVSINRTGMQASTLLSAADEALYAAKEAGRGAVFAAQLDDSECVASIERVDNGTPQAVESAHSHMPEDGRPQELYAVQMACLQDSETSETTARQGSRRRHEVAYRVMVEPLTLGENGKPGAPMRELLNDAASLGDGGADFARWILIKALDAVSRAPASIQDRVNLVMPLPARALVVVPGLGEELMRMNAMAHCPIRHATFVLHNVNSVYDSPAIADFHQQLNSRGMRLGFEIRASTLDVLAPLRHNPFDELHFGRELNSLLRPSATGNAAIEALMSIADRKETTLVAANVESLSDIRHLGMKGINRFAGPAVGKLEPLNDVLTRLSQYKPTR